MDLIGDVLKLIDELVPAVRGGDLPPGAVPLSRGRQMAEFLLFRTPGARLTSDQLKERRELWEEKFRDQEPVDRKKWALAMQAEIDRLTGHNPLEPETVEPEMAEQVPVEPLMGPDRGGVLS